MISTGIILVLHLALLVLDVVVQDSNFVTKKLPQTSEFLISDSQWKDLLKNSHFTPSKNVLLFNPGTWMEFFINGLKKTNGLCTLMFKRHSLSSSLVKQTRRLKNPKNLFHATGYCQQKECPVKVELCIKPENKNKVIVEFKNDVNHSIFEKSARPIRKELREKYQKEFQDGKLPFNKRHEILSKKTGEEILAGNFDYIGKTRNVLNKIASESSQEGRHHENVYQSLLILKAEMDSGAGKKVKGFIQEIGLTKLRILYWTENTISLWHSLKKNDVAFIDATGSVVRRMQDCKRVLYYELSVRNPVKGGPSLPVASMLTEDHSIPSIKYFLEKLFLSEKQLFGYKTVTKPAIINCDFSMALIVAVMESVNKIPLDSYLQWCFKVVQGHALKAEIENSFTVIHVCLAHFMNLIKSKLIKLYKRGFEFVMHVFGLLSRCEAIPDVENILFELFVILKSSLQTPLYTKCMNSLKDRIANKPQIVDKSFLGDLNPQNIKILDENEIKNVENITEEESFIQSRDSPFKIWYQNISADIDLLICKEENTTGTLQNKYFSKTLCDLILKLYVPTIPLWSMLMIGDLKRHSINYKCFEKVAVPPWEDQFNNISDPARTTGHQEQRFYILKQLVLGAKKTHRIDEFSHILFKSYCNIEKDFTIYYLKHPRKASVTKTSLAEEPWNKKKNLNISLQNSKIGKYQKPPNQPIPDLNLIKKSEIDNTTNSFTSKINRKYCPIQNNHQNCWLNSSLQATAATQLIKNCMQSHVFIIDELTASDEEFSESDLANKLFANIYRHLLMEAPEPLPESECLKLFYKDTIPGTDLKLGDQQDPHEFISAVLAKLVPSSFVTKTFLQCSTCGESKDYNTEKSAPLMNLELQKVVCKGETVLLSAEIQAGQIQAGNPGSLHRSTFTLKFQRNLKMT